MCSPVPVVTLSGATMSNEVMVAGSKGGLEDNRQLGGWVLGSRGKGNSTQTQVFYLLNHLSPPQTKSALA